MEREPNEKLTDPNLISILHWDFDHIGPHNRDHPLIRLAE